MGIDRGFPEAVLGAPVEVGAIDVRVDRPLASARLGPRARLVADRTRAVISVPAVATFGVEHGRRVVVDPAAGAARHSLESWMHGMVTPLLLAQRGRFVLHANLVEVDGVAVALAGPREVGKTTTSLVLAQRGGRILGDDVLPLAREGGGRIAYSTTGRPLRVSPETAAAMGLDLTGARRVGSGDGKALLPRPAVPPGTLGAVVVLAKATAGGVEARRLVGRDALGAALANAYRVRLLRPIWRAELFAWAGAIAGGVPVHEVRRPAGGWSGDEVAAAVESVALAARGG
jgi:hypothetical protein